MTTGKVITGTLHRVQRGHGRGFVAEPPLVIAPVYRPARVALMLALAHKIAAAIAGGQLRDQADAARRLDLTPRASRSYSPSWRSRPTFKSACCSSNPLTALNR